MAKTKSKVRCERCGKIVPQVYVCGVAPDVQTPLCDHCIAVTQLKTEKEYCAVCRKALEEAPVFVHGMVMHRVCYQQAALNVQPADVAVHFIKDAGTLERKGAHCGYSKPKHLTYDYGQVTCLTCRLLIIKKLRDREAARKKAQEQSV